MDYPNLKELYHENGVRVIFFHDGIDVLREICESGLIHSSLCYFTFSWFVSEKSLKHIREVLVGAFEFVDASIISSRIRLCFNSKDEYARGKACLPEKVCVLFNNASLLNEANFQSGGGSGEFDAVYNARANIFKRHYLTAKIKNKIFICYDWKFSDVNLDEFSPSEVVRNVKGTAIPSVIKRAKVGLLLSEEEGACYASLEYLLCGLPVVSTPSRGGARRVL